ncbi:nucleotide exchange factor GrpE [Streptomyces sp. NPDC001315]|uniref:nucleotide exchange factor GrpE n=1 Tax=Streptomyces sp. NPDC001315 TaxID=3364562 RepID=UPI0036B6ECE8
MTRPGEPHRSCARPLVIVGSDCRQPGATLEPRRRGDIEPARQPAAAPAEADLLRTRLRERTADLQRLQAEYDNYRKRVRRDRRAVGEIAVANVLTGLLPVLDALDEARAHGVVTGGFRLVADVLETELASLGLEAFGAAGDPFDPALYEAVSCTRADHVERPTCSTILRPGYRVGDQLLRPALAEVTEPPADQPAGTSPTIRLARPRP